MTNLNIRGIDEQAVERIKRNAAARGWTIGKYVEQVVMLHDAMRVLADTPDGRWEQVRIELEALGLETVTT